MKVTNRPQNPAPQTASQRADSKCFYADLQGKTESATFCPSKLKDLTARACGPSFTGARGVVLIVCTRDQGTLDSGASARTIRSDCWFRCVRLDLGGSRSCGPRCSSPPSAPDTSKEPTSSRRGRSRRSPPRRRSKNHGFAAGNRVLTPHTGVRLLEAWRADSAPSLQAKRLLRVCGASCSSAPVGRLLRGVAAVGNLRRPGPRVTSSFRFRRSRGLRRRRPARSSRPRSAGARAGRCRRSRSRAR